MFAPVPSQGRVVRLLHQSFFDFEVVLGIVREVSQNHRDGETLLALTL